MLEALARATSKTKYLLSPFFGTPLCIVITPTQPPGIRLSSGERHHMYQW
jgi:hypothetical protein